MNVINDMPLSELKPHPRNYVKHPQDQLDHLKASIEQHGFYRNVVVARDNTLLAGHGVVEAARQLGRETIPVVRVDVAPDDPRALKAVATTRTPTCASRCSRPGGARFCSTHS